MDRTPDTTPATLSPGGAKANGRGRLPGWTGQIVPAVLVIALGILLGYQYVQPDKRVLAVMAAVVVAGVAWRLDFITSIGLMIFLLPYPKGTVFGTTNIALTLLIAIVWLVNSSVGRAPAPRRSPVDMPLLGLVIVYTCSFYNITEPEAFGIALRNFEIFLASVICFYVIIANVNTSRALEKLHYFQILCALSVFLLGIYELTHVGTTLAGGVISFGGSTGTGAGEDFARRNVRIGSVFGDYELLSEFCVLTILLAIFLWARATNVVRRTLLAGFILLSLFVLFATVTRGAVVSLIVGLLTMVWTTRRRVHFVPLVVGVSTFVALFAGMNYFVSHFTSSGDMFARLSQTHFEGGVPDSRVAAWGPALQRALMHPWIGHGPYYALTPTLGLFWPHNVYLFYASTVGFVGLGFFLLILLGFARITAPTVDSLRHHDYARACQILIQAQFVAFVVNEFKIDYLRNPIYTPVVWAMFSMWVATYFVARSSQEAERLAHGLSASPTPAAR
jgi:O-antigen ligase